MRITYLLPRCTPDDSHGRYVIALCRALSDQHTIVVYSGAFWPGLQSLADCRPIPVIQRPLVAKIASSWLGSLAVRLGESEIVHVQGADGIVGNVVTAHFCNEAARSLLEPDRPPYRRFNYAVGSFAERHSMRRRSIRRIIAVSTVLKNQLVRGYGIDPARITVVHHGVDCDEFRPRKRETLRQQARASLGMGDDEFVVLFIGGNYRLKGLPVLLRALPLLPPSVKILAVGVRQDRALMELIAGLRVGDRLRFRPRSENIVETYAAADCMVLPTRYETFSLVALEAMAMGLPVVISRVAGISEMLTNGVDSFLLDDPTDHDELAHLVRILLVDEARRATLAIAARNTTKQHSWRLVAAETLEVYGVATADA